MALTARGPRLHIRVVTTRKFTHVCAVVTGRYCRCQVVGKEIRVLVIKKIYIWSPLSALLHLQNSLY